jgi:hypothetical protein
MNQLMLQEEAIRRRSLTISSKEDTKEEASKEKEDTKEEEDTK